MSQNFRTLIRDHIMSYLLENAITCTRPAGSILHNEIYNGERYRVSVTSLS